MRYLAEDKQDNAMIDQHLIGVSLHHTQASPFKDMLKKVARHLRDEYKYTFDEFLSSVNGASIEVLLDCYKSQKDPIQCVEDIMYFGLLNRKRHDLMITQSNYERITNPAP